MSLKDYILTNDRIDSETKIMLIADGQLLFEGGWMSLYDFVIECGDRAIIAVNGQFSTEKYGFTAIGLPLVACGSIPHSGLPTIV